MWEETEAKEKQTLDEFHWGLHPNSCCFCDLLPRGIQGTLGGFFFKQTSAKATILVAIKKLLMSVTAEILSHR